MSNNIFMTILGISAFCVVGSIAGCGVRKDNMPIVSDSESVSTTVSESEPLTETDTVSSDSDVVTEDDSGTNVRSAADSESVPTVGEVVETNKSRGFGDLPITIDFDIEGNYSDPHEVDISVDSDKKFPVYHMIYTTPDGVVWVVYVNDGEYLAVPFGDSENQIMKEIVFSETDHTVMYDGLTNEYKDKKLDTLTDTVGVQVERVDVTTLNSYGIDKLLQL